MQDDEIDAKEYELFLARSFWPAFWRCWRRRKFYFTWLTIKQSYIQWRDDETDSLLWFVKSFCKGFNVYFCVGMLFCIGIAEFSYLMALHNHLNPKADDLIVKSLRRWLKIDIEKVCSLYSQGGQQTTLIEENETIR